MITWPATSERARATSGQGEQCIGAGNGAVNPVAAQRHPPQNSSCDRKLAETDGNRTRQTEILGLTGFEDQGTHQESRRLRRPQ